MLYCIISIMMFLYYPTENSGFHAADKARGSVRIGIDAVLRRYKHTDSVNADKVIE